MKNSHLLLACCLLASVGALAGFTHAGLEIRGLGISAASAEFAKDSAGSSILKDHKAVTVKENPAAKEKPQALGPTYSIAEPDLLELLLHPSDEQQFVLRRQLQLQWYTHQWELHI